MIQESPKQKGLGKPGKRHPKLTPIKAGTSRTRRLTKNEWNQPLSRYPKQIMHQSGKIPK